MAKKVVEEAAEVATDAVALERVAVIRETVDIFYNLVVLWYELGISPNEVSAEMDRRERELGMVEKLPKEPDIF
jgi:phosphoribosyl-ATP pyrophosphohydrolase